MAIAILEIQSGEITQRLELSDRFYLIGRSPRCHIRFSDDATDYPHQKTRFSNDRFLSQVHATMILIQGSFLPYYRLKDGSVGNYSGGMIDPGKVSTNGVYVNQKRLSLASGHRYNLVHGDIIKFSPITKAIYLNPTKEIKSDIPHDTLPESGESIEPAS